jgi:N-acetylglucosamine malate deacetylase 1
MKVLVISAHPDDLEIGCGGTLKKLQDQGASITSIVMVRPSAEVNNTRNQTIVQQELDASYTLSKFRLRVFSTNLHADGRPSLVCDNQTMTILDRYIDNCDIAILPNPQDYHQDHLTTYRLAYPLLQKKAVQIWTMTSWPYCTHHQTNTANLHYDISDQWLFKESLLNCYRSYLTPDRINQIQLVNQYQGVRNNMPMAEAFTVVKHCA